MSPEPARPLRCPVCGRMLGKNRTPAGHTRCDAAYETKCGKCNSLLVVPLDHNRPITPA